MTSSHNMWRYSSNDFPQIFTLKIYIRYSPVESTRMSGTITSTVT